ncbi:MAG: excinuclease ABC subunit UvrB [Planctomycetota bacterium]
MPFHLTTPLIPRGDQPAAIAALIAGVNAGKPHQTLLGVTGSGKTFTMAHVISAVDRPALVISHNKTLAAQLYSEFKDLFPENAVEYFVSYYDYYQPEAYIPQRDIYIEKDASINEDIDRLRLSTTMSLLSRRDVIVVASVSCIYGLGSPEEYKNLIVTVRKGDPVDRRGMLRRLVDIQYDRNDVDFRRGTFRVRGDTIEIIPAYGATAVRLEFLGDVIESVSEVNPLTGEILREMAGFTFFPAKHYVMSEETVARACRTIKIELEERLKEFRAEGKLLEAQRLEGRTRYDLELLREIGICKGIENYSRHLSGRAPGDPPYTLFDYLPGDALVFVDESHATIPQLRAMYAGDRSRKETLVAHGFRLPSALDNRPLRFEEWESRVKQAVFVSATPAPYELEKSGGEIVEQIIRPTGLLDPVIEVRPARNQTADLQREVEARAARHERSLITTLTKRLAEELTSYFREKGLRVNYLHSEILTIERVKILRDLRKGKFDCLIGVNLLREGLDLPEVSLVAILDADKEGFLRSETSLVQTIGRTARNVNARVFLYADTVTNSMERAIAETNRRRAVQETYNREHDITPKTVQKEIKAGIEFEMEAREAARTLVRESESDYFTNEVLFQMEEEMHEAAASLDFERAGRLRDEILKARPTWKPALEGRNKTGKSKRKLET